MSEQNLARDLRFYAWTSKSRSVQVVGSVWTFTTYWARSLFVQSFVRVEKKVPDGRFIVLDLFIIVYYRSNVA